MWSQLAPQLFFSFRSGRESAYERSTLVAVIAARDRLARAETVGAVSRESEKVSDLPDLFVARAAGMRSRELWQIPESERSVPRLEFA